MANCFTHLKQRYINAASKGHIFPRNYRHMLGNERVCTNNTLSDVPHNALSYFNTETVRSRHQIAFLSVNNVEFYVLLVIVSSFYSWDSGRLCVVKVEINKAPVYMIVSPFSYKKWNKCTKTQIKENVNTFRSYNVIIPSTSCDYVKCTPHNESSWGNRKQYGNLLSVCM